MIVSRVVTQLAQLISVSMIGLGRREHRVLSFFPGGLDLALELRDAHLSRRLFSFAGAGLTLKVATSGSWVESVGRVEILAVAPLAIYNPDNGVKNVNLDE